MNENPRSARSSCRDETPRSARTPSTRGDPEAVEVGREVLVAALDGDEAGPEAGEALASRGRGPRGPRSIPTTRTPGERLEKRFRMAAEAERRVDEDAAALRPQGLDDLPEEDGNVARASSFHGCASDADGVRARRSPHP